MITEAVKMRPTHPLFQTTIQIEENGMIPRAIDEEPKIRRCISCYPWVTIYSRVILSRLRENNFPNGSDVLWKAKTVT